MWRRKKNEMYIYCSKLFVSDNGLTFIYMTPKTEWSFEVGVYVSPELHDTWAKITVIRVGMSKSVLFIYTTTT